MDEYNGPLVKTTSGKSIVNRVSWGSAFHHENNSQIRKWKGSRGNRQARSINITDQLSGLLVSPGV